MGKMGLEQSALLQKNGQNPEKIVLGHLDLANDMEYYREVLKTGVNIAFDTCGKIAYLADEIRADNLCRLLDEGWGDHIMLSNDISRISCIVGIFCCQRSIVIECTGANDFLFIRGQRIIRY